MTDRLIEQLRAVDPALRMPPEATSVRETTREGILNSGPGPLSRTSHSRPTSTRARRGLVVAVASVLLVLAVPAAGAWAYFTYFTGPETVMDEFHAAQEDMLLPAGAQWVEPNLPDGAVFGSRLGFIAAWGQATNAWLREWVAAHAAQDDAREQAAIASVERMISIAPVHKDGDPEEAGGFVKESIDYFKGMVEAARAGDFSGIEDYLQANP
jgi:hypothetical protein